MKLYKKMILFGIYAWLGSIAVKFAIDGSWMLCASAIIIMIGNAELIMD